MEFWSGINRDKKLETEFKSRMAICEIEKSDMGEQFLLTQFTKGSRRIWMLKQYKNDCTSTRYFILALWIIFCF